MYTKKNLLFNCLLFLFIHLFTTTKGQLKQGQKFLKKKQYDQAIKAFEYDVFNTKSDIAVEAEYYLAKIHFTKTYEYYNLEKAYQYVKSAIKRHKQLNTKEMQRIQKKQLGILAIENYKRQIVNEAYAYAKQLDTYLAYQDFLRIFDGPTPIQFEKITQWRNERGLELAQTRDNWYAYENFYKKHHESCLQYSPEVAIQLQKDMFEAYIHKWTWNHYKHFANMYPQNIYIKDSAAAINYRPIATSKKISDFKTFLTGFPKSVFAKLAIDNIYHLTMAGSILEDYDYFIRSYPNYNNLDKLILKYYTLLIREDSSVTKEDFIKMYPQININAILDN